MILQTTSAKVRNSFHVMGVHSLPGVVLTDYRLRYVPMILYNICLFMSTYALRIKYGVVFMNVIPKNLDSDLYHLSEYVSKHSV